MKKEFDAVAFQRKRREEIGVMLLKDRQAFMEELRREYPLRKGKKGS